MNSQMKKYIGWDPGGSQVQSLLSQCVLVLGLAKVDLGWCQLGCPLHVPVTTQATFLHVTIPETHQTFLFPSVYGARMSSLTLCLNSSDTGPSERRRATSLLLAGVEVQTPFPHPCSLH